MEEDNLGLKTLPGTVTLAKDTNNMVGISIGGGSPYCPCIYIVQVFDDTAASNDGTLQAGDEITSINGKSVKGNSKVMTARLIQTGPKMVLIGYKKLTNVDPKQGRSIDILLKKVKHRLVENLSTATADSLGLSRAILCNDTLLKKASDLNRTREFYIGLSRMSTHIAVCFMKMGKTAKKLGDVFCQIGNRQTISSASDSLRNFGEIHRSLEKKCIRLYRRLKPILNQFTTHLNKAIPDTQLTLKRYADAKFEYLSYCLKVKEMDDEEFGYSMISEPLYRVETGNYEYRLVLRCRQEARIRFARHRNDVLEKIELLDNRHVQALSEQLQIFCGSLLHFNQECAELFRDSARLFPFQAEIPSITRTSDFSSDGVLEGDDSELEISNPPSPIQMDVVKGYTKIPQCDLLFGDSPEFLAATEDNTELEDKIVDLSEAFSKIADVPCILSDS